MRTDALLPSGREYYNDMQLTSSHRGACYWDERAVRGRFRARFVEQISRITPIAFGMFPVCIVRATLYIIIFNLSGWQPRLISHY